METKVTIYTASWCGKCQQLKDFYTYLQRQFPKCVWEVVDVDEAPDEEVPRNIPSVEVRPNKYTAPTTFVGFAEINGGLEMMLDM